VSQSSAIVNPKQSSARADTMTSSELVGRYKEDYNMEEIDDEGEVGYEGSRR